LRRNFVVGVWALVAAFFANGAAALQLIHSERSLYRQVLVYEEAGIRYLCFTRNCSIGRQSSIDLQHPEHLQFDYTHMMMASLLMGPRPASILVVGLGGGSLPRALAMALPAAHIDVVEIDPAVVRAARQYFNFVPTGNTRIYSRAHADPGVPAGSALDHGAGRGAGSEHFFFQQALRQRVSHLPGGVWRILQSQERQSGHYGAERRLAAAGSDPGGSPRH
jgi:spermidine synthase